ncbi:hypothetical protein C5Y96_22860 [Blastopirellula marina]|uniref:FecR protein domain-containing protein n=1 Tax=Blastopirellula marina TaxID=124 RepID=A0A2S8F0G9_9BACT|nr:MULTISPECIES: FecR family protein [Pirellulaceae]PQO25665.1 hypothetical protein C5Y96_22860 [Blastopirellula marina]RCS43348.1 hypothetical protein DTL36_22910 [Bremerella cremea]
MPEPEHPLLDRWLEDTLSNQEEQQLSDWLKQDPQNMRTFVEANIREQQLKDAVRSVTQAQQASQRVEVMPPRRRSSFPLKTTLGLALALSVLVVVWLVLPKPATSVQVNVIALADAQLTGVNGKLSVGKSLSLGSFRLDSGTMELMLPRNVRVEFIAPVEAVFEGETRLRLIEGCMSADVGDGGKGFTVVTAAGNVVDLGTSFGLEVERDGESRVAVFSGTVEFHPAESMSSLEVVTLTEGEALRFSARAGLRRWQQVALAADRVGLPRIANAGVVREVHDNLGEGELRPFYAVIPEGMKPGALAFNDKPNPVWGAVPGQEFPAWLNGADLIRTYYHFRFIKDYELTLDLNEPADVYLLVVSPGEIPPWVAERFQPTGASIRAGTWHPTMGDHPAASVESDGPYLNFEIWKCEAQAGEFKLGAPLQKRLPGGHSMMYGLAVKARTSS